MNFEQQLNALWACIQSDRRILRGDEIGPSDASWQDVAGTMACNLRVLANALDKARKGDVPGTISFFTEDTTESRMFPRGVQTESDYWNWKDCVTTFLVSTGEVDACSASGDVTEAVESTCDGHLFRAAFADLGDRGCKFVRDELRESGAWDEEELSDDEENFHRIVWQLACDWKENNR